MPSGFPGDDRNREEVAARHALPAVRRGLPPRSTLMGVLIGIDLAEVERVAGVLARTGERFLARVFLPDEIHRGRRHPRAFAEHVAGRFAAKEAAMKALGTGWRGLSFKEISIGRESTGKPRLIFLGRALERARQLRVVSAEVSITHTAVTAAAAVVLVTEDPARPGTP